MGCLSAILRGVFYVGFMIAAAFFGAYLFWPRAYDCGFLVGGAFAMVLVGLSEITYSGKRNADRIVESLQVQSKRARRPIIQVEKVEERDPDDPSAPKKKRLVKRELREIPEGWQPSGFLLGFMTFVFVSLLVFDQLCVRGDPRATAVLEKIRSVAPVGSK